MSLQVPPSNPDDLEERLNELEFLQRLDHELHYLLDSDRVLDITLDWAMRRTAADTGLIAKRQEDSLQIMRVTGYAYQYAAKLMREPWPLTTGVLGRVATNGKPIYMAYVTNSSDYHLIYEKTRSHYTVPLIFHDETIGILHLESRHPAHFNQRMRDFIQHVAGRSAVALRNAELYTQTYNAEQLKSDMIRMVAHDLRNPLNTIMNATHLLKRLKGKIPDPAMNFVQSIEQSAHQMRTLLEELLTLERLESGLKIEPTPLNLNDVLVESIQRTQSDADSKSQALSYAVPEQPLVVRGEFAYFRQAMVNLISNAIKYTPHKGAIEARLENHGERAFFEVTDNGYGISPERQKWLFQRFYRAKEPGTEHIEGTGLGLSLVKAVIERSDGEVWFQSTPGQGSTFGFWLPIVDDELPVETRQKEDEPLFAMPKAKRPATQPLTPLEEIPPPPLSTPPNNEEAAPSVADSGS